MASAEETPASFADLGLDPRLLRALAKKGYTAPTPVQAHAIPKSLEGKDVIARARTGSGKTMAYILPTLHMLLGGGDVDTAFQAVILVPTRELCEQACYPLNQNADVVKATNIMFLVFDKLSFESAAAASSVVSAQRCVRRHDGFSLV